MYGSGWGDGQLEERIQIQMDYRSEDAIRARSPRLQPRPTAQFELRGLCSPASSVSFGGGKPF